MTTTLDSRLRGNDGWGGNDGSSLDDSSLRDVVREKYGAIALKVLDEGKSPCCGTDCCTDDGCADEVTGGLYSKSEAAEVPEAAILASLGCGNPTALASLSPGEVVLDLGSGGGIDVLLSARRVGPTGFAYGLDMTDEMLALAEQNRTEAGVENVTFLQGHIEAIPLPDNSVDVIISNCVINLSADKDQVFREALRVLKPGGRFAVSDIVTDGELPESVRGDIEAYVGCVAGALDREDYLRRLTAAGFVEASIEPTRKYTMKDAAGTELAEKLASLPAEDCCRLDGAVMSAFIRAEKPAKD